MKEVETKILDVDKDKIVERLNSLGAKKVLDTSFKVDWFRISGLEEGKDPWFLRIRTTSDGKSEVTWKSSRNFLGAASEHKEINLNIADHQKLANLFEEIGLEKYAHQEKNRISWLFDDWRFDLDKYPKMPAYLEIEGKNEEHIQEAIKLLFLEKNKATPEGERVVIQEYGLDWYNMCFD